MEEHVVKISPPTINITYYFHNIVGFFSDNYPAIFGGTKTLVGYFIAISIPLSLLFFIGIIYAVEGLKRIRNKEEEIYNPPLVALGDVSKDDKGLGKRWDKVLSHVESQNENDWRQAIIEADIMLEELLNKLGYRGEGIGEKLSRVSRGDFKTLSQAGEAHGVRNRIAHDGSNYKINQYDARQVINLYKAVFEEFYHI